MTNVTWTNVAWTNVAWTNGTGPLIISQRWIHKLEMASMALSLGGWVKVETKAISVQQAGTGTELCNIQDLSRVVPS